MMKFFKLSPLTGRHLAQVIGILFFVLLFFPKLITLGVFILAVFQFLAFRQGKLKFQINGTTASFLIIYLLYFVYSFYTRHGELARSYLEYKLLFLAVPLFLLFRFKPGLDFKLLNGFIFIGVIGLMIDSWVHSIGCQLETNGGLSCFLTNNFSYRTHPTYQAVFFTLGLLSIYSVYKASKSSLLRGIAVVAFLGCVISIVLCLSLAGLLFLFALTCFFSLRWIYKRYGRKILVLSVFLVPTLVGFVAYQVPNIQYEVDTSLYYADQYVSNPQGFIKDVPYPMNGTQTRLVMWTVSVQIISDYFWGVGTGNVDEVIAFYLRKNGQDELVHHAYNPHNQFFQTWIEIGFVGFIVLIYLVVYGSYHAYKRKNYLMLFLLLNLLFNMLFESMLQRQSGIIFYTFALCLMSLYGEDLFKALKHPTKYTESV